MCCPSTNHAPCSMLHVPSLTSHLTSCHHEGHHAQSHALEQSADISQQLLDHGPTLTAKSPSGGGTPLPRASLQPRIAGKRVYLDQATPAPSKPHSHQPKKRPSSKTLKTALSQRKGDSSPRCIHVGLSLSLPLSDCVPLEKSLSLSGLQLPHLENGYSGAILLPVNAVTQDPAAH